MPEGAPACKSVGGGSREPASLGEARFCSGANVPFGIWRGPPEVILAIVVRVSRHVGALPQRLRALALGGVLAGAFMACSGGELHLLEEGLASGGTGGQGATGGTTSSDGGVGNQTGGAQSGDGGVGGTGGSGGSGGAPTAGAPGGGGVPEEPSCEGSECEPECPSGEMCEPSVGCTPDATDCVPCLSPYDCPLQTPICHPVLYRCVECTFSEHCWGFYGGYRPVCWAGRCAPCRSNTDCPLGMTCENSVCGSCSGHEACPSGFLCRDGLCGPP